MTATIRYLTPYLVHDKVPLSLSFALSDDISLRSILNLSTLLDMYATIDLQRGTLTCSEIQYNFLLQLDPPGNVLPDSVLLDISKPTIPTIVHSNIFSTTSIVSSLLL